MKVTLKQEESEEKEELEEKRLFLECRDGCVDTQVVTKQRPYFLGTSVNLINPLLIQILGKPSEGLS